MAGQNRHFAPGEIVFTEGESTREAYILLKGTLEVVKNSEVVAEITEEGSFIGEMAVLLGDPRTATIRAKIDTDLGVVTDKNFDTLVQKMPTVAYKLAKSLAFRLKETTRELIELRRKVLENPCSAQTTEAMQEIEESIEDSQATIPEPETDLDSALSLGDSRYSQKDFIEAVNFWQKAMQLTDSKEIHYQAMNNIGCAYMSMGELKKSMVQFANTLKLNPHGVEVLSNFALIYLKTGNPQKAAELYNKILKVNPENQIARNNLDEIQKGTSP